MVDKLYQELNCIFKEHTINFWKNNWWNEGDRNTKSKKLLKIITNHNMFLLCEDRWIGGLRFELRTMGGGFRLEVTSEENSNTVKFEIKDSMTNKDIYYYVTDKTWETNKCFILDLCKSEYEIVIKRREMCEDIPNDINGSLDPIISLKAYREEQIKEILD